MKNKIYLQKRNKILLKSGNKNKANTVYVATILKNIENLGYTFSQDIIDILNTYSEGQLEEFYIDMVKNIKSLIGYDVKYEPMYPNFPKQVMEADECELYINAIIHYLTFGTLKPYYEKEERFPLIENTKLKVIELGNEEDFKSIFKNLLQSKTSISQSDKEIIKWFVENYKDKILDMLPEEIPLKENIALISNFLLEHNISGIKAISRYFKTATDVLRLATAMSEGDISLAKNTKFKRFKRRERRLLLSLLESCNNIEEDMLRYKNRWIRLGEILHPSEYKTRYPKVQNAFYKIRNNIKIETFNGKINELIKNREFEAALKLLKQRPGEFARKLDYMLRITPNPYLVLNEFKDIADNVSTTVLLQVMEHFKYRNDDNDMRVFFPKGNVAKAYGIENNLPNIDKNICNSVVNICENSLISIFKDREFLGKVYIDENLKNYKIPFSQRSASKALKTIARGSKIDIEENCNTLRAFIYWKNGKDRTDIDLSAVFYYEDWLYQNHISYTNLKINSYNCCHSGDITNAPDGASEFIDLDLNRLKENGVRYIVLSIHSFTEQPYCDLPTCYMGWMSREYPNSGEIYEPKTVEQKIDVASNTTICIPMIIDLAENKIIWTDLGLTQEPYLYNNIEGNQKGMVLIGKAMTNLAKPNLYDLFKLHRKARGIECDNIEEADAIFSLGKGITPYDNDIIISEYL